MKFRNRSLPWTWFGWRALALSTVFIAAAVVSAQGQMQFQRLKSFGIAGQQGAVPFAPLIQASDGALYGTTEGGGNRGQGTVFRLNPDGSGYTELKSFSGASGDGGSPKAALVQGGDGALYGTTAYGGSAGCGTVFKLNPDGSGYTVLKSFTGTAGDGSAPMAALLQGSDGALYGTTADGGSAGYGTVFKLNLDGSGYAVLKSFSRTGGDGRYPYAALLQASDGALYGTTAYGGSAGYGTVFKLNMDGSGYAVLKSFSATGGDGRYPYAALSQASDGALYGTTSGGGSAGDGAVFKLDLDGSGYTVLMSFPLFRGDPRAGLLQASDGALYGTTVSGGYGGTVFKVNLDGSDYTVLKEFSGTGGDGRAPFAAMLQASDGVLYGTTAYGDVDDPSGAGTVFKLNPDGSGYTVIRRFDPRWDEPRYPQAAPLQASDGALYGTTSHGGSADLGTVYKLNPDGTGYTVLKSFENGPDGVEPFSALIQASDGALYGTARLGGATPWGYGAGTVFKLNPDGSGNAVLMSFPPGEGYPWAALMQGSDGALYGTTYGGSSGGGGYGTVFKLNLDGSGYTVLKRFSAWDDGGGNPTAALVQGSDGALYGTTSQYPSPDGYGTVFKLNPDGSGYTVLKTFTGTDGDGANPHEALVQGSDGVLYGTTSYGGSGGGGTVFKLNLDGSGYAVLRSFTGTDGDGAYPFGTLVQGSDGALYGTTNNGGTDDYGTVFRLNTDGSGYTQLKRFTGGPDGAGPYGGLIQGTDGALYGTATYGGDCDFGVVFRLAVPDDDADGVSDPIEDGAPNGGDGNADGIRDALQPNVSSLPNAVDGQYVTLVSPAGTTLADVRAVAVPAEGPPAGAAFPVGFFEFTVKGLVPGGGTVVTLVLPAGTVANTYYKYGPVPADVTAHWYAFPFDGTTGAQLPAGQALLYLVDGQRGDDDLAANGEIRDLGGPALVNGPPTVNAHGPYAVDEGGSVTLTATGSDPDGDVLTYGWDLNGDGVFEHMAQSVTFSAAGLDGPREYPVAARVFDTWGLQATSWTSVTVRNAKPSVGAIAGPGAPTPVNKPVAVRASFADPGVLDTHTAVWAWGDGRTSVGTVTESGGSGTVDGTHSYAAAGTYTVTLSVADKDGGTGQSVLRVVVASGPRVLKAQIRDALAAMVPTLSYAGDRTKLQGVVAHLNTSLEASRWIDDSHVTKGAQGEGVFNEEKAAVIDLKALRTGNKSGVAPAVFQSFIDRLVAIDRELAATAINDAVARRGSAAKIKTAGTELTNGDVDASKDYPDKAIDHYKNAWKNAVAA